MKKAGPRFSRYAWLLALVGLQGCIPVIGHYDRIDAAQARYFKDACRASVGPPVIAYFPYHGIYLSAQVNFLAFGVHLPAGSTAQLLGTQLQVSGVSSAGAQVQIIGTIEAHRHDAFSFGDADRFGRVPDPYFSGAELAPLSGETINGEYRWYLFLGTNPDTHQFLSLQQVLDRGTMQLPAMRINGTDYPSETIPFSRAGYSEIMPVNC